MPVSVFRTITVLFCQCRSTEHGRKLTAYQSMFFHSIFFSTRSYDRVKTNLNVHNVSWIGSYESCAAHIRIVSLKNNRVRVAVATHNCT